MTGLTELQQLVLTQIQRSRKGNEMTGAHIGAIISLVDDPEKPGANLRSVVNALRKKGYPILANGKGYYWPSTKADIQSYKESLIGRIRKQQEALAGIVQSLETYTVQSGLAESAVGLSKCHNAPTYDGGHCTICRKKDNEQTTTEGSQTATPETPATDTAQDETQGNGEKKSEDGQIRTGALWPETDSEIPQAEKPKPH